MSKNKKTILVVDDEKDINNAVCTALKDAGFNVISALDGKSGLALAFEQKPDLIFLDIIMPEIDGIEFLNQLREDDWGKNASVIVMTVVDDMEKMAEVMEKGGEGYVLKSEAALGELVQKAKQKLT